MTFQVNPRRAVLFAAAAFIAALYLADLSGMGLVSKDEPRYADIGRAMARTGDWITPRLSGTPWFEKPPLLYWMIASGFAVGLGTETAPRLPVALLSLAFLVFFWVRLSHLCGRQTANYAAAMLATSAGWIALSHVAITDIPIAVFFNAALLLFLNNEDRGTGRHINLAAASLGLAVLAKSLPPLVFFLPALAIDFRRWRDWLRPLPILIFLLIAVPWHVVAWTRNGYEFVRVLFIEQQFGRFFTPERQHIQPWWFYIPVFALFLFPWFPLLAIAAQTRLDRVTRALAAVVLFGLIFLSTSVNKLPTYVLPLVPASCVLMGSVLAEGRGRKILIFSVAFLGMLPFASTIVPVALATRLSDARLSWPLLFWGLAVGSVLGVAVLLLSARNSFAVTFFLASVGFLWLQISVFPRIDRLASARSLWIVSHPACTSTTERGMLYGLYYYAGTALPPCDNLDQAPDHVVR